MHWQAQKQIGILRADTADVVHQQAQTDWDPPGRHNRRGALASTETDLGPTQTDRRDPPADVSEHKIEKGENTPVKPIRSNCFLEE